MRRLLPFVLALWGGVALAGPSRVVSINLCTDQLAMLLAAPGQLISVSHIARDARVSAMAEEAHTVPINHGAAEEIYLLRPDLVLASTFTSPATVHMLRQLGIAVEIVPPSNSLDDVPDRIIQLGAALGRESLAADMVAAYGARRIALQTTGGPRPRAALYAANGYTSGQQTLAGQILDAAGLTNIAGELGYTYSGVLPLEHLALAEPDMLIASTPYPRPSRAEEILDHPVVRRLAARTNTTQIRDADWVCGTPHVLNAVEAVAAERARFLAGKGGT